MTQPEYRTTMTATLDPEPRPEDRPEHTFRDVPEPEPPETPEEEPLEGPPEEPQPQKPDLSQARSFLTELHPSGFGELLVTDVWFPPVPKPTSGEQAAGPPDRQALWRRRQEYRELNLLRERAPISYDARTEHYWHQVKAALAHCPDAIVDPYTSYAAGFADADHERMAEYRREAQEYGYTADSLLRYGRACLAIGRLKSARGVLHRAVKMEPYLSEAWWNLGLAHLFARANKDASEALSHALDQNPGDYRIESALGVARFHERKYEDAEEHFRRTAGPGGLRAACRSLLTCSLRMQGKWDEARIELGFLKGSGSARWALVAEQCLDCVARGEERTHGPVVARRRNVAMLKSLAAAGASGGYLVYSLTEHWFQDKLRWAAIPLFLLGMVFLRSLRGIAAAPNAGEFGNYEQGLPCWQASTWMKPKRQEF